MSEFGVNCTGQLVVVLQWGKLEYRKKKSCVNSLWCVLVVVLG